MAFGQQAGPPATAKQVQELLGLLVEAGHVDFRDARGPMGFNQRQAAGRFTRGEAAAFIERLQQDDLTSEPPVPPARAGRAAPRAAPALQRIPSEELAAELQRRGWVVMEP